MPTVTVKRCHLIQREGKAKAFLSLDLNGAVVIHGCRLVECSAGLFLAMPQQKSEKDGKWYDQVQVLRPELKMQMQEAAVARYQQEVGGSPAASPLKDEAPF